MRGSPLIQAIVTAFFILTLAWPVHLVTRPLDAPVNPGPMVPEKNNAFHLEIVFSGTPDSFSFEYLGNLLVAQKGAPGEGLIFVLPDSVTTQGVDILGTVVWPGKNGRQAFEVKLLDAQGNILAAKTCWSEEGKFEGRIPLP